MRSQDRSHFFLVHRLDRGFGSDSGDNFSLIFRQVPESRRFGQFRDRPANPLVDLVAD